MMNLVRALDERTRPPPPPVLAHAFMTFIEERLEDPGILTRNQAQFLSTTFEYLLDKNALSGKRATKNLLEMKDLEDTLTALAQSRCDRDAMDVVNSLAETIFRHVCHRIERVTPPYEDPSLGVLQPYISVLSSSGSAHEALDIVESYWEPVLQPAGIIPWIDVIKGFAKEGKEDEVLVVIEKMRNCGVVLDQDSHEEMIISLASENCMGAVKSIYEASGIEPSTSSKVHTIHAAIKNSMITWAAALVDSLPRTRSPEARDVVLLLGVAQGEPADFIERRMKEMIVQDPAIGDNLTMDSINLLLEHANAMNRHDLVDGYVALAKKWGLEPNAHTYLSQMYSRLQAGDMDAFFALFEQLEIGHETGQADTFILNKLVKQLCAVKNENVDYDMLMSLVNRLADAAGRLEPETLGAFCYNLLYRHDLENISSLLRPTIETYSPHELSSISDGFIRYISDMTEPTENAWEAYELLKMAFPTTSVQTRTDIMTVFFDRKRSDLAALVFGHMRQREDASDRPNIHTYAQCLQGIANAADAKNLHLVHNMLKLDLEVGLNTKVLNGLMLAYASCEMPNEALAFFKDILHSDEGPSEQTLVIFFRVCETYHDGMNEASKMMEKLKAMDVRIDRDTYTSYIGALGGHCELERAAEAIRTMEAKIGCAPTSST